jgi:hypothetical protein
MAAKWVPVVFFLKLKLFKVSWSYLK